MVAYVRHHSLQSSCSGVLRSVITAVTLLMVTQGLLWGFYTNLSLPRHPRCEVWHEAYLGVHVYVILRRVSHRENVSLWFWNTSLQTLHLCFVVIHISIDSITILEYLPPVWGSAPELQVWLVAKLCQDQCRLFGRQLLSFRLDL